MKMIENIPAVPGLKEGEKYHRWRLHEKYGGNHYAGISAPSSHPYVFIFTGKSGEEHGYIDEFRGETLFYTGVGKEGDMKWNYQNKSVRDHKENGTQLHIFEDNNDEAWSVTYRGEYEISDWDYDKQKDTRGISRQAIVFKFNPRH